MSRSTSFIVAIVLGASLPSLASAQSPPGGFVAATAPGGTEGAAGPANVAQAIRGGNALIPGAAFEADVGPLSTGSIARPAGVPGGRGRPALR